MERNGIEKKTAERALGGQRDRQTRLAVTVYPYDIRLFSTCQPLSHLATLAHHRADRDLAIAEAAKITGDRPAFWLHRRRGLKHQAVWLALRGRAHE